MLKMMILFRRRGLMLRNGLHDSFLGGFTTGAGSELIWGWLLLFTCMVDMFVHSLFIVR